MASVLAAFGRRCSLSCAPARRNTRFEVGLSASKFSVRASPPRLVFLQRTMSVMPSVANTRSRHWSNRGPAICAIRPFSSQDAEVAEENASDTDPTRFPGAIPEGTVVMVKKFPALADTSSVVDFFEGLNIAPNGILFLINPISKKRMGSVLVAFASREDAETALSYHNKIYRDIIVNVSLCESQVMTDLLDSIKEYKTDGCVALRMTGLPYSFTEDNIVEFFGQVMPVAKDKLDMLYLSDGSFSGDAIVRFDSEQDRKKAMGKNGTVVDTRTINLIKITPEEYFVAYHRNRTDLEQFKSCEKSALKLLSLPFGCTMDDLADFLADFRDKVEPDGIKMVYTSPRKFTGVAYVKMMDEEVTREAVKALNNKMMGIRYISVHQCYMAPGIPSARSWSHGASKRSLSTVLVRGFPYGTSTSELLQFFSDFDIKEDAIEMAYDHMGRPAGSAYVTFPSTEAAWRAIRDLNYKYIGSRYVELLRAN